MDVCILTIIKNEQEYIEDFVKYHLNMGIDHIYFLEDYGSGSHLRQISSFSNNNISLLTIDNIIKEENKEELDHRLKNNMLYQGFVLKYGLDFLRENTNYDWCFIIDIDEYITIEKNNEANLKEILKNFSDYEALVLSWMNFGANGNVYKPNYNEKSIPEIYTQITSFQKCDRGVGTFKTAYNLKKCDDKTFFTQHAPRFCSKWCNTNFVKNKFETVYDKLYIRHYITKSWEEYVWKVSVRGMFSKKLRNYDTFFELNKDMINKKEELMSMIDDIITKYNKKG